MMILDLIKKFKKIVYFFMVGVFITVVSIIVILNQPKEVASPDVEWNEPEYSMVNKVVLPEIHNIEAVVYELVGAGILTNEEVYAEMIIEQSTDSADIASFLQAYETETLNLNKDAKKVNIHIYPSQNGFENKKPIYVYSDEALYFQEENVETLIITE